MTDPQASPEVHRPTAERRGQRGRSVPGPRRGNPVHLTGGELLEGLKLVHILEHRSMQDAERFPAADRVPIQVSAWVDCPNCGRTKPRLIRTSRAVDALGQPEFNSIAIQCDRCGDDGARIELRYGLVLH